MRNKNLTTIYVVRHAESEGNAGIIHGEKDELGSKLTGNGKNQAKTLANELKGVDFAAIFTSTLIRAKETAEILKLGRKLAVEAREAIVERSSYNYAKKIGRSEKEIVEEMKKDFSKLNEIQKLTYKHSSVMESSEEAAKRFLIFAREVAIAYKGKNVLVVNHGNVMRNVLAYLGVTKYDYLPAGAIPNTGYFVLESDGMNFFVKEMHGINIQKEGKRIW